MKRISFVALGALLLASCSEEREPQNPVAENIRLTVDNSVLMSRTSTAENEGVVKTVFVAGDKIGVYATGGAVAANVEYTVAADGSALESSAPIAFSSSEAAALKAYSPFSADATASGVTFAIAADQSSAELFNGSNFMTATASATKEAPSASLSFNPRMALVYVEMAGELGAGTTALTLCGMKPAVEWSAADDNAVTTGNATDVTMHKLAGDAPVFMAFVPAQTSADGATLFNITIADKKFGYTPAAGIDFKAGTVKRFRLTVNDDRTVNIESSVVPGTDWTEDGDMTEIGSGEIVPARMELISAAEGDFTGKTLAAVTGLQGTVEGWNAVISSPANATMTINGDEAVVETLTGTSGWYQRALVYRTPAGKGSEQKYRLEFDVKGGTDIQVAVMRGQTKDVFTGNAYFNVGGATTSGKVEKTEAEYTRKSLLVDMSQISTGAVDFSTGIAVVFYAKDAKSDQTHCFRNVSLVEAAE